MQMAGYQPHIWMSCSSISKLCVRLFQLSAATETYPGLVTVHPLSLSSLLCVHKLFPTATFANTATSQAGEVAV